MPNKELAILGCGGHARAILDVVLTNDPDARVVFVDENAQPNEKIITKNPPRVFEVVPEINEEDDREYFVAVGDNQRRRKILESLGEATIASVIAKDAEIRTDAEVEPGCYIGHHAIVGPFAHVGKGSIINTRSHISHEVVVGQYSQLALDVTVGGRTEIGDEVFIGMRACIFDRLKICSGAKISAASVVRQDITIPGIYVGSPARLVK